MAAYDLPNDMTSTDLLRCLDRGPLCALVLAHGPHGDATASARKALDSDAGEALAMIATITAVGVTAVAAPNEAGVVFDPNFCESFSQSRIDRFTLLCLRLRSYTA